MSKVSKAILLGYNTCEALNVKWQNILDSYYHKDEGKIIISATQDDESTILTLTDDTIWTIPHGTLLTAEQLALIASIPTKANDTGDETKQFKAAAATQDYHVVTKYQLDNWTATDSLRLGNKLPSYYAKANDLTEGLSLKENAFDKNSAFNKNFGAIAGTVAEGNDSRIVNGQTAFDKKINSIGITGDANKILTLTRQDGTTLTEAFTDIDTAGPDVFLNSLNFNKTNGNFTAVLNDDATASVNLDGRYSLLNHSHNNKLGRYATAQNSLKLGGQFPNYYATATALFDGLEAKENSFDKNTAFNKNFGVREGTVMEGHRAVVDLWFWNNTLRFRRGADVEVHTLPTIIVDAALSATSQNPLKNRAIYSALARKANTNHVHNRYITAMTSSGNILSIYREGSTTPEFLSIVNNLIIDSALSATSQNPLRNSAIYSALQNKENVIQKRNAFNKTFYNGIGTGDGTVLSGSHGIRSIEFFYNSPVAHLPGGMKLRLRKNRGSIISSVFLEDRLSSTSNLGLQNKTIYSLLQRKLDSGATAVNADKVDGLHFWAGTKAEYIARSSTVKADTTIVHIIKKT